MRARLHFAIATSVSPRILLIDEALSVGDKEFRAKAQERIDSIVTDAGTLILVSHSLAEIRRLCARELWIEKGELRADGPVDEVLAVYEQS
jgi:teichoic acid transport system ATP-binding protein